MQAIPRLRTVIISDTKPPVIILKGQANTTHEAGSHYVDANVTAYDLLDGNSST